MEYAFLIYGAGLIVIYLNETGAARNDQEAFEAILTAILWPLFFVILICVGIGLAVEWGVRKVLRRG
jgi:hypothetical protein